jgi:acyl carrier protein
MDINEIRAGVLGLLSRIAPDVDAERVDPKRPLRDQFDFDSMDALHFATALSEAFHLDIPERDYAQLASLEGAVQFVLSHLPAGGGAG